MIRFFAFVSCLAATKSQLSDEHDGLIRALTKAFARKHVQTVTAASTCWPPGADRQLLFGLSSADISANFRPSVMPAYDTWYKHGVLVDLACVQTAAALFAQASRDRLFDMHNNWMLVDSRGRGADNADAAAAVALETFETHLNDCYVLPESNVFLFVRVGGGGGDDGAWDIWEGFRVGKTEKIQVRRHGTATSDRVRFDGGSVSSRTDLRGITLKATTVISEPNKFHGFRPFADTDLDIFAHMHNDLNAVLQDQLNFKMSLDVVDSFGWDLGNGSFSGLTGQLQREECDFGGIGSFIRIDRMAAIDFTVGTFHRQPAALFKQPPLSSVRNICVLPFNNQVWTVTLFTFLGFAVLIVFLARTTERFKTDGRGALTVLDAVTIVHGAICQQGHATNLSASSVRVAVFVLFLTAVFLFTSYSASIVALLQSPSDSVKTVHDLVGSSMSFTAQVTPYGEVYFNESDDPSIRALYDRKMKPLGPRKFTTASEGVARIRTEFHGFMIEVVSAYKLIGRLWREEEKCGFSEIQLFKLPVLALAVVKKSGYKDVFKQKLIHQQEVGIKNRIIRRWMPAKPVCDSSNRANQFVSVSIKDIYPMLQILAFGSCASFVILLLEIGHDVYAKSRSKRRVPCFGTSGSNP